jgi:hypothetical protein
LSVPSCQLNQISQARAGWRAALDENGFLRASAQGAGSSLRLKNGSALDDLVRMGFYWLLGTGNRVLFSDFLQSLHFVDAGDFS